MCGCASMRYSARRKARCSALPTAPGTCIGRHQGCLQGSPWTKEHSTYITDPIGDDWLKLGRNVWLNLSTGSIQATQPSGIASGDLGTCDLKGTPTSAGVFPFTVKATDVQGGTSATYSGTIKVMGFLNSNPLPSGNECSTYNEPLGATGGDPPYSYAVSPDSSLPSGMSITNNALTGQVYLGSYSFKLIVIDGTLNRCSQTFALVIKAADPIQITTATPLPNGSIPPGRPTVPFTLKRWPIAAGAVITTRRTIGSHPDGRPAPWSWTA